MPSRASVTRAPAAAISAVSDPVRSPSSTPAKRAGRYDMWIAAGVSSTLRRRRMNTAGAPGGHCQCLGDALRRRGQPGIEHARVVTESDGVHRGREAQLLRRSVGDLRGGDECTFARLAEQEPVADETVERLSGGHSANAEALRQFALRRNLIEGLELTVADAVRVSSSRIWMYSGIGDVRWTTVWCAPDGPVMTGWCPRLSRSYRSTGSRAEHARLYLYIAG